MDPEKLLKLDLSYPGISYGYHSWALELYLESIESFVAQASDQYRKQGELRLEAKKGRLDEAEVSLKQNFIDEAADVHIPAYARMSAIVLIWGLFESTVFDITAYVTRREGASLKLREIRADSFENQVRKYYSNVLNIELTWTEDQVDRITNLHKVRNAIAHRNGKYLDAAKAKRESIAQLANSVTGIFFQDSQLFISKVYVEESAELVFSMLGDLSKHIGQYYDGPIVKG